MSQPTAEQRQLIESWAAEGANLNQIQDRLRTECGVSLTYMDTRLLIMEMGVKIQEKPRPEPPPDPTPAEGAEESPTPAPDAADAATGELRVTVDEIPPAGAVISGKATFSDGQTVAWFMDQMGRFGMNGSAPGYQPPPADVPAFQAELDRILSVRGF